MTHGRAPSCDGRAVDTQELFRVELLFQAADRLAQEVALLIIVDAHVISFGLDAVHVLNVQEKDAAAILDHETFEIAWSSFQLFE